MAIGACRKLVSKRPLCVFIRAGGEFAFVGHGTKRE